MKKNKKQKNMKKNNIKKLLMKKKVMMKNLVQKKELNIQKKNLKKIKKYDDYSFELFKFVSYVYQGDLHCYIENGFLSYIDIEKIYTSFGGIFDENFIEWLEYYKEKFNYNNHYRPKDSLYELIMR